MSTNTQLYHCKGLEYKSTYFPDVFYSPSVLSSPMRLHRLFVSLGREFLLQEEKQNETC